MDIPNYIPGDKAHLYKEALAVRGQVINYLPGTSVKKEEPKQEVKPTAKPKK